MIPTASERDAIFKAFGRAFFRRDVDALYEVVTPDFVWRSHDGGASVVVLDTPDAIRRHFAERQERIASARFENVVFHHADDATFMTFTLSETERATGAASHWVGVERYTFRDGRIAMKDVYRKPVG